MNVGFVDAVVAAWKFGFSMFYPKLASVRSVSVRDNNSINIKSLDGGSWNNVASLFPGKVKKGSRCVVFFPDNSPERAVALGFNEFDSFSTLVGDKTSVRVDDVETSVKVDMGAEIIASTSGLTIKFNQFTLKLGFTKASLENASLKIELDSILSKIKLSGDVSIDGDLSVDGKVSASDEISSDEDVKAGVISLKNHTHSFTDPVSGPNTTNPPS